MLDLYEEIFERQDDDFKHALEEAIHNPFYIKNTPDYVNWCKLQIYEMEELCG